MSNMTLEFGHSLEIFGSQVDQLENKSFLDKKCDKSKCAQNSLCGGKIS